MKLPYSPLRRLLFLLPGERSHTLSLRALAYAVSHDMAYIVGAEIYDHLEKVVDRFEDVANRISGVLIEHL